METASSVVFGSGCGGDGGEVRTIDPERFRRNRTENHALTVLPFCCCVTGGGLPSSLLPSTRPGVTRALDDANREASPCRQPGEPLLTNYIKIIKQINLMVSCTHLFLTR